MDVRSDGLTLLWLRVMWRANPYQRDKVNEYMNAWIKQVKTSEAALAKSNEHGPISRVPLR